MRLVLHVGMGKTGTSTLQRSLREQRKRLAKMGILYPLSDRVPFGHHQALMCLVARPDQLSREFATRGVVDADDVRATGKRFWDDVVDQARADDPQTVVLTYESLLYIGDDQVARLREILGAVFDEIDVVAYIRHPASHWLSRTQQGVKTVYDVTPPGEYHNRVSVYLGRYLRHFDGRVSARAFDPAILRDGCIVQDFLAHHLPETASLTRPVVVTNVNESISAEAMCVLQDFHRFGWPDAVPLWAPESGELLDMLQVVATELPQTTPALRPEIASVLVANHREELDWLAAHFGMEFPSTHVADRADDADVEVARTSADLRELLTVDRAQVDRTLHHLVRLMAARSLTLRESEDPVEQLTRPNGSPSLPAIGGAVSALTRARVTRILARASARRPG